MRSLTGMLLGLLCAVLALPAAGAEPCGQPAGDWAAGDLTTVAGDRGRLLVGHGAAVVVAAPDAVSEVVALERVARSVWDLEVEGTLAVVAAGLGVTVLDLGEPPSAPSTLSSIDLGGSAVEIEVDGHLAVVEVTIPSPYSDRLVLVDLADPTVPAKVGPLNVATPSSFALAGTRLYATVGANLLVYDIARPDEPELLFEQALGSDGGRILDLAGDLLITRSEGSILVFDLSDPAVPSLSASHVALADPGPVAWLDQLLVVAEGQGLEVLDLSTPGEIRPVASLDAAFAERVQAMTMVDTTLVSVEGPSFRSLGSLDLSDPLQPRVVTRTARPGRVRAMAVDGETAAVITDHRLWLQDLAAPEGLQERGHLQLDDQADLIDLSAGLALVGSKRCCFDQDFAYRLDVVDVTDSATPTAVGRLEIERVEGETAWTILQAAGPGWLAVALDRGTAQDQLTFIDLRQPAEPAVAGTLELWGTAEALAVRDSLVFAILERRELMVVDASDPSRPQLLDALELDGYPGGLAIWGRYVLVASHDSLIVVDGFDPSALRVVGSTAIPYSFEIASADGLVAVVTREQVRLLDVTDPASITVVADLPSPTCYAPEIALASVDGALTSIVGGSECGLHLRRVDGCLDPAALLAANFTASHLPAEAGRIIHFSDHSSGRPSSWAWNFGDGATSDDPSPDHVFAAPGTYTVRLTVTDGEAEATISQVLTVADPTVPLAAAFRWTSPSGTVARPIRFFDRSSGRPTSWQWDFGDGYGSTARSPFHVYSLPGVYPVRLVVGDGATTAAVTRDVDLAAEINSSPPFGWVQLVPAAASVPGEHDTHWQTDLVLSNPTDHNDWAEIYLFERGDSGVSSFSGSMVNLHPRQTLTITDVVSTLFDEPAAGSIRVGDAWQERLMSRTYTTDPALGSWGQAVPAVDLADLPREDWTLILPGLPEDDDVRSNLGLVNLRGFETPARITALDPSGRALAAQSLVLAPYATLQLDHVLRELAPDTAQPANLVIDPPGQHLQAWASVVDNRTGDAVFVPATMVPAEPGPSRLLIPAVAATDGVAGTRWRSELVLFNPGPATSVNLTLLVAEDHEQPPTVSVELAANETRTISDVVSDLFQLDQLAAALLLEADGPLVARSRTFTASDRGTYGQNVPPVVADALPSAGEWALVLQLREDAAFRTNLGLANPEVGPARVRLEALLADGTAVGEATVDLAGRSHRQINRALPWIGGADAVAIRLTVVEGRVAAYGSVVDNTSGDPVLSLAVPQRR